MHRTPSRKSPGIRVSHPPYGWDIHAMPTDAHLLPHAPSRATLTTGQPLTVRLCFFNVQMLGALFGVQEPSCVVFCLLLGLASSS